VSEECSMKISCEGPVVDSSWFVTLQYVTACRRKKCKETNSTWCVQYRLFIWYSYALL